MNKLREICLIEDDKIQVFLASKFITKTNLVEYISSFKNGKEAYDEMLERLESNKLFPDIIFLDINMPVWDGWSFYEAFTQLKNADKVSIFILTSSVSDYDVNKAEQFGLKDKYLAKPLSFSTIEKIVTELSGKA